MNRTRINRGQSLQVSKLVTVTPHDTNYIDANQDYWLIYVSATGNVRVLTIEGDDIVFPVVNPGWQSILVTKVFATSTTTGLTILAGK